MLHKMINNNLVSTGLILLTPTIYRGLTKLIKTYMYIGNKQ